MMTFFAIITENGLDQIVETKEDALRESKELMELGISRIMIVPVLNDDEAEDIANELDLFLANLD